MLSCLPRLPSYSRGMTTQAGSIAIMYIHAKTQGHGLVKCNAYTDMFVIVKLITSKKAQTY